MISGLLGMGDDQLSLWYQARDMSLGKFSYCLQTVRDAQTGTASMYLRFGNDITQPPQMQSTPIKSFNINPPLYYLTLQGITVDTVRLAIDPTVFAVRDDETGGCIIDTGTGLSYIVTDAYNPLLEAVTNYIDAHNQNVRRLDPPASFGFRLCYERISG